MNQKTIKILSLILCLALLAGCSAGGGSKQPVAVDLSEQQANSDTLLSNEEMSYVLIYNPDLYDEYVSYNELLNTGDFASYVEAIIPRADGPAEIPEVVPVAAMGLPEDFDANNFDLGGSRGGAFVTPYSVGDTHAFYCGEERELKTFTCVNTGENCNIWTFNNAISSAEAQTLKSEFDSKIYPAATEMFGESRFASNGGKVNILVYPMDRAAETSADGNLYGCVRRRATSAAVRLTGPSWRPRSERRTRRHRSRPCRPGPCGRAPRRPSSDRS